MAPKMKFPKAHKASKDVVMEEEDNVPLAEIVKKKRSSRSRKDAATGYSSPETVAATSRVTRCSTATLIGTPIPTPVLVKSSILDRSSVDDLSGLEGFQNLDETELVIADVLKDLCTESTGEIKRHSMKGKEKIGEPSQEVATRESNLIKETIPAEAEGEKEQEINEGNQAEASYMGEGSAEKEDTVVLDEEIDRAGTPVATEEATVEVLEEADIPQDNDPMPEVESVLQPVPPALQEVPPTTSDYIPEEEDSDVEVLSFKGRKRTRGDFHKKADKSQSPVTAEEKTRKKRKKSVPKRTKSDIHQSKVLSQQNFDSNVFTGLRAVRQYEILSQKEISCERGVRLDKLSESGIMPLLEEAGLIKSLTEVHGYSRQLVLEFYSNLKEEVDDEGSEFYHQAFVRGHWINFSPSAINNLLGLADCEEEAVNNDEVITELTGGKIIHWVNEAKMKCKEFTLKYAILHKLAVVNWMHTKQESAVNAQTAKLIYRIGTNKRFNLGSLIFDRIQLMVSLKTEREMLKYPNLIHKLCLANGVEVQDDSLISLGAPYAMSTKLMMEHFNDMS